MSEQRPDPMVLADVDISKLDGFMLDTKRLISSELVALASAEEFKAAVLLWCRAWQQSPPASLPNDDRILASFAMVDPKRWPKVRTMALRGFIECADGRLYHKVLAVDALRAWEALSKRRDRTKAATEARKKPGGDDRNEGRDDNRNGPRNGGLDGIRNEQRNDDRNDPAEHQRNEVPTVARDGTGRDGNERKNIAASGRGFDPPNGSSQADDLATEFLALRSRHWPRHPDLPAPLLTLITEAGGHLARGGTPELIAGVIDRGMIAMARKGQRPPTSIAAFGRSLDDAIAKHRHGASGGVNGSAVSQIAIVTDKDRADGAAHQARIKEAAKWAD